MDPRCIRVRTHFKSSRALSGTSPWERREQAGARQPHRSEARSQLSRVRRRARIWVDSAQAQTPRA